MQRADRDFELKRADVFSRTSSQFPILPSLLKATVIWARQAGLPAAEEQSLLEVLVAYLASAVPLCNGLILQQVFYKLQH